MMNIANSYYRLARHADAVKLHEETLSLKKAKLGLDHPDTLKSMMNLATVYDRLGRHEEALKLQEETLALRKAKLGPDHPDTLMSMLNLAACYHNLRRYADSLKLLEETQALNEGKLGPDHPQTLQIMWGRADSLIQLERGAEAVPIIDECVRRAVGKVVDPHLLPEAMRLRLRHFEKIKDGSGCRQSAEMWEKLNRTDAGSLYYACRFRVVTATVLRAADNLPEAAKQVDAEADRAIAWLKQAVAAGFKDAAQMKKDTDLDALRNREDFQKLLAKLESKK
jgi:tetratricopeptide (TPR) repeat protein